MWSFVVLKSDWRLANVGHQQRWESAIQTRCQKISLSLLDSDLSLNSSCMVNLDCLTTTMDWGPLAWNDLWTPNGPTGRPACLDSFAKSHPGYVRNDNVAHMDRSRLYGMYGTILSCILDVWPNCATHLYHVQIGICHHIYKNHVRRMADTIPFCNGTCSLWWRRWRPVGHSQMVPVLIGCVLGGDVAGSNCPKSWPNWSQLLPALTPS